MAALDTLLFSFFPVVQFILLYLLLGSETQALRGDVNANRCPSQRDRGWARSSRPLAGMRRFSQSRREEANWP